MLKLVAGLVAGATLLTVGTVSAFASSQGNGFGACGKTRVCDTTGCNAQCYVDADNDGVCDNCGAGGSAAHGCHGNGHGAQHGHGSHG